MISLPTAKLLLMIALALGPKGAHEVYATCSDENYAWSQSGDEWMLKTKGYPSSDWKVWKAQPAPDPERTHEMRTLARHRWSEGQFLDLENGNQIEKRGRAVFYIVDPGAPNERDFTILYPRKK